MEARAQARYIRVTPMKARRVVDLIRGMTATEAQAVLRFAPQAASVPVGKVLDSAIDIQNYIEYMAVEMYSGNTDTLNVKRYRNGKADGKWRWVLFDLDWAFHEDTNSFRRWLNPGGMGNGLRTDNTLFIACMKNDTFRDRFLTYLGRQMATTFSPQSVLEKAEAFYNTLKLIMPEHYARWNFKESAHRAGVKKFVSYANSRPKRMLQFIKYCDLLPLSQAQMEHYFGDIMQLVGVTYDQIKKPS